MSIETANTAVPSSEAQVPQQNGAKQPKGEPSYKSGYQRVKAEKAVLKARVAKLERDLANMVSLNDKLIGKLKTGQR